jgi:DeoR/GlpR family transcriptional regulator of sugar metabolism
MLLTMREKTRIEAVQAVMDGRLTVAEAATALKLSERQVYRSLAAARERGLAGLVHGVLVQIAETERASVPPHSPSCSEHCIPHVWHSRPFPHCHR